jgi:hypothetical protein
MLTWSGWVRGADLSRPARPEVRTRGPQEKRSAMSATTQRGAQVCPACHTPYSEHRLSVGTGFKCPSAGSQREPFLSSVDGWTISAILCALFALVTLFVMFRSGASVSECTSGAGALAQGFSSAVDSACGTAESVHAMAEVITIATGIGFFISLWKASR